jgi:hypothetical protein
MSLSQREAAAAWHVSRATIQRYIRAGKLARTPDKSIDPAEMVRVFGEPKAAKLESAGPDRIPLLEAEMAGLRRELAIRIEQLDERAAIIEDLRSSLRRLAPPDPPAPTVEPSLWQRLFG